MSELFRSALGYLGNEGCTSDDYVGRQVEVAGLKLRIKKVIAEGGFAFVYVAQDTSNGKFYALKRLLASDEAARAAVEQEVAISHQLSGHPNIVDFIGSHTVDRSQSTARATEFLLLSELCSGGSMIDALRLLEDKSLPLDQVCAVVYQTARAVQHMQMQEPPILHRDLKVENLLISDDGRVKLCDFGSATTSQYIIDDSWTAQRRSMLEDEMASHTTPMYRAPEMLDTWNNFPINCQADMWALGCILYYLCYLKHPFEDSAKLRIINGNYSIPAKDGRYDCLHALMRGLLCVDPRERFSISDVLERLAAVAESKGFNMKGSLTLRRASIDCSSPVHEADVGRLGIFSSGAEQQSEQPATLRRPAPSHGRPVHPPAPPQVAGVGGSGLFSSLKGYSGSIFKNIKDTSSKVISTVSQSMVRTDLDMTYLTSRLVVMSFPAEGIEAAYRSHIDDVRAVLDGRHSGHYTVYNVSGRHYSSRYSGGQLVHINWDPKRSPALAELYQCCSNVALYLCSDPANVAVIHCMVGLLYC